MDDYIILDVNKYRKLDTFRSNKPTVVRQGELNSEALNVQITKDGQPYNLTDTSVYFEATRSDGYKFVEAATIANAEEGYVSHVVPAGLMIGYGKCELAYFAIHLDDGSIITTENMDIVCLPGICMFTDSDYTQYIENVISELEGYLENVDDLNTSVSDLSTRAEAALANTTQLINDNADLNERTQTAIDNATAATSAANTAASDAKTAASSATSAATEARNASANFNSIASILESATRAMNKCDCIPDSDITTLADSVANLKDSYIVIDETLFIPNSKASISSETITWVAASVANETNTIS